MKWIEVEDYTNWKNQEFLGKIYKKCLRKSQKGRDVDFLLFIKFRDYGDIVGEFGLASLTYREGRADAYSFSPQGRSGGYYYIFPTHYCIPTVPK